MACPHCHGPRDPARIAGNFLCTACVDRAADALGWPVAVATELDAAGLATKLLAVHEDWTQCVDVGTRCRAYVDDIAFRVLPGEPGEAFLQPLAVSEPLGTQTKPGPEDTEKYWELVHVAFRVDIEELQFSEIIRMDYESGTTLLPFGQLRQMDEGFLAEVVSNQGLPVDDWPLDLEYFQSYEWQPPNQKTPYWHTFIVGAGPAAARLVAGMRWGRACLDPLKLTWETFIFLGPMPDRPPG